MANLISLFRVLLCLATLTFLSIEIHHQPTQGVFLGVFLTTVIIIWLDGVDGYVARKLNESSKLGAVVDIMGDRIVEYLYWLYFLSFGWVALWLPVVVIVRGVVVDGLRSIGLEQGLTAFGSTSMMQSKLGILLVSSRFSRWSYAFFKAVAFSFMILAHTPELPPNMLQPFTWLAEVSIYATVFFCVIRGLPVIVESKRFFRQA